MANLQHLVRSGAPVRISGWLLWDAEHPEQIGKSRGTEWKIHPAHLIEVKTEKGWVSLDALPNA
jgi:hypothetical protein